MDWNDDSEDARNERAEEERAEDEEHEHPPHLPAPWEVDEPEDEEGVRRRHDAFTPARRNAFLKALAKTGCVLDACRLTGVSSRTVYYHQGKDYEFLKLCTLATRMCETPLELTAFERGVVGIEQEVVVGGRLVTRVKHSDAALRLLLQGANPKKYGPRPGFKRKRLLKHERKQMEREIRAEIASQEKRWTFDEAMEALEQRLKALEVPIPELEEVDMEARLAGGWTRNEEGHWVPPGYVRLPGPGGTGPDAPRDSM
jgi:hypothetical protein